MRNGECGLRNLILEILMQFIPHSEFRIPTF